MILSEEMHHVLNPYKSNLSEEDWQVWQGEVTLNLISKIANDLDFATAFVMNCEPEADRKQMIELYLLLNTENPDNPEVGEFLHRKLITETIATQQSNNQTNDNYKQIIICYCSAAEVLKEEMTENEKKDVSLLDYQEVLFEKLKPILKLKPEPAEISLLIHSLKRLEEHFNNALATEKDPQQILLLKKSQLEIFDIFISNETWPSKLQSSMSIFQKTFPDRRPFYLKIYDALAELVGKPHQVPAPANNQKLEPKAHEKINTYKNVHNFRMFKDDLKAIQKDQQLVSESKGPSI